MEGEQAPKGPGNRAGGSREGESGGCWKREAAERWDHGVIKRRCPALWGPMFPWDIQAWLLLSAMDVPGGRTGPSVCSLGIIKGSHVLAHTCQWAFGMSREQAPSAVCQVIVRDIVQWAWGLLLDLLGAVLEP